MKRTWYLILLLLGSLPIQSWATPAYAYSDTDYSAIRGKWKQLLTGGTLTSAQLADPNIQANITSIEVNARTYWSSMDTSAGRSAIWYGANYEYSSNKSSHFTQTYSRLKTMALASALSGTTFSSAEKTAMKNDIISAMEWVYDHWYNPSIVASPPSYASQASWPSGWNWFDFQISAPLSINDIVTLLYDDFTSAQIANYMETILHYNTDFEYGGGKGGTLMTGANLAYKASVFTMTGANLRSVSPLLEVNGKLGAIFEYETEYPDEAQRDLGDGGFYTDGSYLQHYAHPYIGGYGIALMNYLPKVVYALADSPWAITDPRLSNMYQWVYNSITPFLYRGSMMDMVRGREVAFPNATDQSKGTAMIRSLLFVADFAPAADALKFKRMIKHWIQTDTYRSIYTTATIAEVLRLKQLMNDTSITAADAPLLTRVFPIMDRAVMHRPGFGFGLSMYSSRIQNYEMLNNQNLRGWYQSEGMTYIYTSDLGQYGDQYWATVSKQRLAGTTVDTRSLNAKQYADSFSGADWVGGVTIADETTGGFGAAGMDLKGQGTNLTGKKSWFMFDDEIVALGAGITSTSGTRIDTIVDNRKIADPVSSRLTVDGAEPALTLGTPAAISGVSWAHLEGDTPGSDIGYYFPDKPDVTALKETRSGQWSSMTTYPSDNKIVTLSPERDAYVHQGAHGNDNYGANAALLVKGSTIADHARKSYLAFNLAGVTDIVSAKLLLYGSNTQDNAAFPIAIQGVETDNWTESSIVWNNSPSPSATVLDSVYVNNLPQYREWDVTNYVKTQAAGDGLASFLLQDLSGADRLFTANSREANYNRPQLVLQVDPLYTRSYASLTLRHGVNPSNKSYAYVLLPNQSKAQVSDYTKHPEVTILRNDTAVQAVREKGLHITGANFWSASPTSPQTAGLVTVTAPSSVMVKENADGTVQVSVSDPTHLNTGLLGVELAKSASGYTAEDGITVTTLNPIRFSVNTNGAMGKTFTVSFTTSASSSVTLSPSADAYIRDGSYANTNFGGTGETLLRAKTSTTGYTRKSYLKFELTGISNVRKATLRLYGNNSETTEEITVRAYPVSQDDWTETGITWSNAPAASLYPLDAIVAANAPAYREWDVTGFVQSEAATDRTVSFMLEGDSLNFSANSRENAANPPVLVIE